MIPDETFRVEKRTHEPDGWKVMVRTGEPKWDWMTIYYANTEQEALEMLQWFVDRMKAYVVGV